MSIVVYSTKLTGSKIKALDGDIGEITDLYFDDERWVIRCLVTSASNGKSARCALISPISLTASSPADSVIYVDLAHRKIRNSPDVDLPHNTVVFLRKRKKESPDNERRNNLIQAFRL